MCLWIEPYTRIWKRARFGCESKGFEVLEVVGVFEDLDLLRVSVALKILQDSFHGQPVTKEKECKPCVHLIRKENQILVNNAVISFYSQNSLTSADNLYQ